MPIKNFREKGAWAYPGNAQIFWVAYPYIISGTGKATDFKLGGTFTGPIRIKAHQKFWRKGSVGVSMNCQNFLGTPILSQERVKLRTSNLAGTFTRPIRIKAH